MTTVTRYPCSQQLRSLLSLISRLWSPVFCLPSPVSSFQSPSPSPVSCLLSPNSCLQSQSPVSCLHLLSPSPVSISCLLSFLSRRLSSIFHHPYFITPSPLFIRKGWVVEVDCQGGCRAGNSHIGFTSELLVFCPKKQANELFAKNNKQFTHFWWVTWAICSRSLISFERPERITHGCSLLVSDLSDSLTALIFGEQPERIAHGRSFVLSNLSNSLADAHFLWAIPSRLLICLERSKRIAHSRSFDLSKMSKWVNERWVNERIPSPGGMGGDKHAQRHGNNIWKLNVSSETFVLSGWKWWCVTRNSNDL